MNLKIVILLKYEEMKQSICLAIMCKNDYKDVLKTMNDLRPYVTDYIIMDCQSEDNVIEECNGFFENYGVVGRIFVRHFVDQAHNKTELI